MKYIEDQKLKEMKKDISHWEQWFDLKFSKRHYCVDKELCERLEFNDMAILKVEKEKKSVFSWALLHIWLADKEEIADGEADFIGEVITQYSFGIGFCPFCGKKLD